MEGGFSIFRLRTEGATVFRIYFALPISDVFVSSAELVCCTLFGALPMVVWRHVWLTHLWVVVLCVVP